MLLPLLESGFGAISSSSSQSQRRRGSGTAHSRKKNEGINRHNSSSSSSSSCTSSTEDEISKIVDVSRLAHEMRLQVRNYSAKERVCMVGILAEGPGRTDAETYSEMIQASFAQDGLDYSVYRCAGDRPEAVEAVIREMNHCRPDVHGILAFYPIFQQSTVAGYAAATTAGAGSTYLNPATGVHYRKAPPPYYLNPDTGVYYKTVDDYLRDCVVPAKDVEGVCRDYKALWHRRLFRARGDQNCRLPNDVYIPCTVNAILKILETFHLTKESGTTQSLQRWQGCTATVVNRSAILGRPLAALLALEGATVYSVDENSIIQFQSGGRTRRCSKELTLNDCLRQSSVVVTAVPDKEFRLDCNAIADHTTVIDVSEHSNVDHETLLQKRGIRLIPSVGKVTVATLEQNLIRLHRQQQQLLSNTVVGV